MNKIYYIAEIGLNHNGDIKLAKKMIKAAKASGADAVKFQSIKANKLVSPNIFSDLIDGYGLDGVKTVGDFWEKVSINKDFHIEISEYSQKLEIEFISTPFDFDSVDLLEEINIKKYKIASGDLTHYPLLEYISKKKKPVILSTGASTLEEIRNSIEQLKISGCEDLTLLHCISLYPTPPEKANLNAILKLKSHFKLPVGFSDHTIGYHVSIAAIAIGAQVIEKHFTTDKNLPGPDQSISASPEEFSMIVEYGNKICNAIKVKDKVVTNEEKQIAKVIRRSIVAAKKIEAGHVIKYDDLDFKRPGTGISPVEYNKIIGMKLKSSINKEDMIKRSNLEK
jgi:N,N'-diacetyllegionaminate synthase